MKRRLLVVTTLAVLVFLVVVFSPGSHPQPRRAWQMTIAIAQKGTPIKITSVTATSQFLYSRAEVKNVSGRPISAVTFGLLLHAAGAEGSKPVLASNRKIESINIAPGETRTVDIYDVTRDEGRKAAQNLPPSDKVIAEFGILAVDFSDGGSWDYDWKTKGSFDPQSVADSSAGAAAVLTAYFAGSGLKPFRLPMAWRKLW